MSTNFGHIYYVNICIKLKTIIAHG